MPPTKWSLSSILLITTSGLCLFPSIQALHPLTKLVFATALWQLLRLDQQLHKDDVSARLVYDIESTCSTGMRRERFNLEGTAIDMWKSPAEILANSRRTLPKAHLSEHIVTLQLGGGSQSLGVMAIATPNAAGTRKMTSS